MKTRIYATPAVKGLIHQCKKKVDYASSLYSKAWLREAEDHAHSSSVVEKLL